MTSADEPTQEWVLDDAPAPAEQLTPPAPAADAPGGSTPAVTADGDAPQGPRTGTFLLAGALVLALVAGVIWAVVATTESDRRKAVQSAASTYLHALADADARAALDTLAERPLNSSLLTDQVLRASRDAAPWSDISVGEPSGQGAEVRVPVSYRLGDRPVETTLTVVGNGQSWHVADGLAELLTTENGALTVNGATLDQPGNPVFPGTYTASPTVDLVTIEGERTVVVPSPDAGPAQLSVRPVLSEQGRERIREAVRSNLDACLAAQESAPAGCPFGVDAAGVQVKPGSVRFKLTNDPWAGFDPALDPDKLVATGVMPLAVHATATVTSNGFTAETGLDQNADRTYVVDLASDPLKVTWR